MTTRNGNSKHHLRDKDFKLQYQEEAMSSHQPGPQLDDLLRSYVSELPDWPISDDAIDDILLCSVPDPYSDDEVQLKVANALDRSTATEMHVDTAVVGETLPLFGDRLAVSIGSTDTSPVQRPQQLVDVIREAFLAVSDGASTDKVVADPELNALFIHECWRRGAQSSQLALNKTLFYARKNNKLGPIPRVRPYRVPRVVLDQYLFASELALRLIQDQAYYESQRELTLDDVLCDPATASAFEAIARRLAPGFESLDYRWAALTVRKAQQRSTRTAGLRWPQFELLGRTDSISLAGVPAQCGFYWLQCDRADIFVGHTDNLRTQVDRLFQVPEASTHVIPEWVGHRDYSRMELAVAPYAKVSPSKREPFKTSLVTSWEPLYNAVPKGGAVA